MNREFAIRRFEIDFDNFIEQMLGSPNFIKDGFEQLALDFGSHSARAIDTDQAGVKRNIRKLPTRPWATATRSGLRHSLIRNFTAHSSP
jgi:hypothetical protein